MANRKYIYFAEIERFGYTLQCIGFTEEEVRENLINEYIKAYTRINGIDPREDEETDYFGENYFKTFLDELNIEKRELGKVEWR